MNKWDIIVLIINIILVFISGLGAYKSIRYFKRSKHITIYAQTNQSLNEIEKMLKILPDALEAASTTKKGVSPENTVRDIGKKLTAYLNAVMNAIPTDYSSEFRDIQKKDIFVLSEYINSFIDGTAIIEESGRKTLDRIAFNTCQNRLREMHEFLKRKIAEEAEKLT